MMPRKEGRQDGKILRKEGYQEEERKGGKGGHQGKRTPRKEGRQDAKEGEKEGRKEGPA